MIPGGKISRRSFLSSSAAAGTALAAGCTSSSAKPRPRFGDQYDVIDCHVHLPSQGGRFNSWHPVIEGVDGYIRYMQECGVEFAIGTGGVDKRTRSGDDIVASNDSALYWQSKHPDFIRANCNANPEYLETSLSEMERMRKAGCAWLGELVSHSKGYRFDIPEFYKIMKKAIELEMVVQIHCSPEEFTNLSERFPEATMVLCHFADVGHGRAEQVARFNAVAANPKGYIDTSGAGVERIGMLEMFVEKAGAERALYGSDMPINDPSQALTRVAHAFLSEEQKKLIFAENVRRLLNERGVKI
jgi:predicted TIM-barrel fold metal-dependent hydrolase